MKTITKVYTKYDTPVVKIIEPYIVPLEQCSLADDVELCSDIGMGQRVYEVHNIDYGLCGVRYFHYGIRNEID